MRSIFDLRLSRWALLLLAAASAAATVLILRSGGERTPAQVAALAALHQRLPAATVAAASGTTTTSGGGGARHGTRTPRATATAPAASPPSASTTSPAATPTAPAAVSTTSSTTSTSPATGSPTEHRDAKLPKVGHVFEIVLSAPSYRAAFGRHSELPYLRSLTARGTLLRGYHSLGRGELADELALVSGQKPNPETTAGCTRYADFPSSAVADKAGLVPGRGCVYPETALTVGDQFTASGKTWHAFVADMGSEACVHPNTDAVDDVLLPFAKPGYDTRHNPFIYFHSLLDLGDCSADDVALTHLPTALRRAKATPEFTYVAPDACADGDPTMVPSSTTTGTSTTATTSTTGATAPVATTSTATTTSTTTTSTSTTTTGTSTTTATTPAGCPASAPAGLGAENAFLRRWIPRILASPAYRRDGVLVIALARSGSSVGHPVSAGALVLSRWAHRGRTLRTACNPYALLRLTEDGFGYTRLAEARSAPALAGSVLDAAG